MTMDEYRREHDDHDDLPPVHCCDYCGEVIEPGWPGFEGYGQNRGVYLHKECVTEWVVREYDAERLALEIGFDKLPEVIL